MLHELLEPALSDSNPTLLRVFVSDLEALLLCLRDDILHVLLSQSAQDTEKELSFRELVRELFLRWQVLAENSILHRILVEILDRDLLVGGYLKPDDLVLLEMRLLL